MRRGTDYLLRLRPWSLSAFGAAFIAVTFAATMQEVLTSSFDATAYFFAFISGHSRGIPAGQRADDLVFASVSESARADPEVKRRR